MYCEFLIYLYEAVVVSLTSYQLSQLAQQFYCIDLNNVIVFISSSFIRSGIINYCQ